MIAVNAQDGTNDATAVIAAVPWLSKGASSPTPTGRSSSSGWRRSSAGQPKSPQKRAAALETARGVAAPARGAAPHPRDRAVTGPPGEQAERAASLTEESALRPENLPDAAYIAAGHVDDAQGGGRAGADAGALRRGR